MSSSGKVIKVSGYKQQVNYGNTPGISYRDFSVSLAGQQLTSYGGTALFTGGGNFAVLTNDNTRLTKLFKTNKFSPFYTLSTYGITTTQTLDSNNNSTNVLPSYIPSQTEMNLNLDKRNILNYAYFGSFKEFIRVELEQIILNWPASLYINNLYGNSTSPTLENYVYDNFNDTCSFKVNVGNIINKYNINYLTGGTLYNSTPTTTPALIPYNPNLINENDPITITVTTPNDTFQLSNLSYNYVDYVVSGETNDNHAIIGFTGLGSNSNYIYINAQGNPFPTSMTGGSSTQPFHIMPSVLQMGLFLSGLDDFSSELLNTNTTPLYTSTFRFTTPSDSGTQVVVNKSFTWPTSDGYNLDYDTTYYMTYVSGLIDMAEASDDVQTDLIARFFVSESITAFDTMGNIDSSDMTSAQLSGQKVTKLLRIYGREFDEINKYITGLADVHTVSYNKENNAPDAVIKTLANMLGWQLAQAITDNDILLSYLTGNSTSYSGINTNYTPIQAEVEFWRRLIINSPWVWKSKGTRKAIEFIFKLIGTPEGLMTFNEYVYVAKAPINMDLFNYLLLANGGGASGFTTTNVYLLKEIISPTLGQTPVATYQYYCINNNLINFSAFTQSATTMGITFTSDPTVPYLYSFTPQNQGQMTNFTNLVLANGFILDQPTSTEIYPVDNNGYPEPLPDTSSMYYQSNGLWYRETGGLNSTVDTLIGNNPHIGPYDGGFKYINQFEELIPNFNSTMIYQSNVSTGMTNIFTNYNSGTVNNLSNPSATTVYASAYTINNNIAPECFTINAYVVNNPCAATIQTNCGCLLAQNDDSIRVDISCLEPTNIVINNLTDCNISGFTLGSDGLVVFQLTNGMSGNNMNDLSLPTQCCVDLGFTPEIVTEVVPSGNQTINTQFGNLIGVPVKPITIQFTGCRWGGMVPHFIVGPPVPIHPINPIKH